MTQPPTHAPLDPAKFPLTLAVGLRMTFADVVSAPLPERLAALMRCLSAVATNCQKGMGQAPPKHRTVLIVEDDAELRSLTAALLDLRVQFWGTRASIAKPGPSTARRVLPVGENDWPRKPLAPPDINF